MVAPPRQPTPQTRNRQPASGQVRIIGGRWRGSKLSVVDHPGLRPTSDRVRETLFNWLAPMLHGSACVDLFAGTGALGLEAASRGAAHVVLVEREARLAENLREQRTRLQADHVEVVHTDALAWLTQTQRLPLSRPVDLAFVDPPFALNMWTAVLAALTPCLAPQAWVYVESAVDSVMELPEGFELHRQGATRDVAYRLFRTHQAARSA